MYTSCLNYGMNYGTHNKGHRANGFTTDAREAISAAVSDRLDTRVGISLGQRKGRMTIEFASMEDLGRILDILGLSDAVTR